MIESPKEILSKFTPDEKKKFQSRISKYMCENHHKQKMFNQVDLLINTGLNAYIDEKMKGDFIEGKKDTVYGLLTNEIMNDLVGRGAVKSVREVQRGNTTTNDYEVIESLIRNCEKFNVSKDVDIDEIMPYLNKALKS